MSPSRVRVERAGQRPAQGPGELFRQEARGLRRVVGMGRGLPAFARERETQAHRFNKIRFLFLRCSIQDRRASAGAGLCFRMEQCSRAPVA